MKALPAYICGNHLPSSIAHGIDGFIRSSLGDVGHNGRGFLIWTFVIFLPLRDKQRRMAPKAARGTRLKPGSQERRPLDPQPLVRGGITRNSGFGNTGSGGNGLAAASEGEIDLPLYAPGLQSNVGLAQEVVSGAGNCKQVAAAAVCLLPSTDPSAPACTLEAIRDYRQGRVDLSAQGEVGANFFSLSDQSQDSDEDSTSPSIDSETCDSSTAPLTPISVLRGTTVKRQSNQTEITRLDKAGESSEKRGKKRRRCLGRELCPGTTQKHNNCYIVWVIFQWLQLKQRREKQRHPAISTAQTELASLESQIVALSRNNVPKQDTLDKMTVTKAKIIQLYLDQDIIKAQSRTQECYEFSERVGKVLAYKTRQKVARSAILAIKDRLGQIVYGDTLVLQVFKEYYSALYQQENLFTDERDEKIAQYLSDMSFPKLSQEEGCQLTAPLSWMRLSRL
ncbi:hypothetical protein NDU88_006120 [Pleurodeles waltl]|uniref:Uncharacterized protein n=1 Tax=Pleurodeles waltl TaxID=8319 RepID=A0AAV7PKL7_PLEWA|nr:hypothetical protein NDU88_006120 [Pleurodeles waltl]